MPDDTFTGSTGADWVSYAGSTDTNGVVVDLRTDPATGLSWCCWRHADGYQQPDRFGLWRHIDYGNSDANILRGGAGDDIL